VTVVYLGAAVFLLLNLVAGVVRIVIGPSATDRMLAAQLFGTTGVAAMLFLAYGLDRPALVDAALVFAVLSVIGAIAFVRRHAPEREGED
jgi:multicomponent Na+:H+ antiporter subunit F